jgi:hypothetical protein
MMDECVGHMTERVVIPPADQIEIVPAPWTRQAPGRVPALRPGADGMVPEMVKAGDGYRFHVTGLTHDERGYPAMTPSAQDKLVRRPGDKIRLNADRSSATRRTRSRAPTWSSSPTASPPASRCGPSRWPGPRGIKVGMLRLVTVWPFPEQRIRELAGKGQGLRRARDELGQMVLEVERCAAGKTPVGPGPPRRRHRARPEVICRRSWRQAMSTRRAMNPRQPRSLPYLRMDRMPHIWCPGCGIGTTVNCFARALTESASTWTSRHRLRHRLHRPRRRLHQARLLPHHPRPGHPLRHRAEARQPRAQGGGLLRRRRPVRHRRQPLHPRRPPQHGPDRHLRQQLHLRHDRRPGAPDDAGGGRPTTMPYGNFEHPFNLPFLADSCGAVYVARWTDLPRHAVTKAMKEACRSRASPSSRSSPPAPPSTGAATGSATGSHRRRQVRRPRAADLPGRHERILFAQVGDRYTRASQRWPRPRSSIGGFGGQGVILSGTSSARAAAIFDQKLTRR